jgi:hypothetical protein
MRGAGPAPSGLAPIFPSRERQSCSFLVPGHGSMTCSSLRETN